MLDEKISVIMGIYNCADTLGEAIDSILAQTYTNWELIMCDDGSIDNTYDIAKGYVEKYPTQMKVLKHSKNMGLNKTLNDCLQEATGAFIGRMDGDDISLPERFEKEMKAFEEEPELAVVSCAMLYFDENGIHGGGKGIDNYPRKEDLVLGTVHAHAPAVIRREVMESVQGYTVDDKLLRVEDWHLWIKIYAKGYRGKNLGQSLYMMRENEKAMQRKTRGGLKGWRVSLYAMEMLNLPKWRVIFALRHLLLAIMPRPIYESLHFLKMKRRIQNNKHGI